MADEMVGQAANTFLIGPGAFCEVPKCSVKKALKLWETRKTERN